MRPNRVREQLQEGGISLGGWVMTGSAAAAEIQARAGFDWVCVDAEHSAVTTESVEQMLRAIALHGAEPFVRIALNDGIECKKALDAGARGIVIPMIRSAEDVRRAVSHTRYPPTGERSFSLVRAAGYGADAAEYFAEANRSIVLVIMIEHIDAVHALEAILAGGEVDAILVGPYDLSGSMGKPGRTGDPDVREALETIRTTARALKVPLGIHEPHATVEKIQAYREAGYQLIGCGIDTLFISEAAQRLARAAGP